MVRGDSSVKEVNEVVKEKDPILDLTTEETPKPASSRPDPPQRAQAKPFNASVDTKIPSLRAARNARLRSP